jgi:hypothetical protein
MINFEKVEDDYIKMLKDGNLVGEFATYKGKWYIHSLRHSMLTPDELHSIAEKLRVLNKTLSEYAAEIRGNKKFIGVIIDGAKKMLLTYRSEYGFFSHVRGWSSAGQSLDTILEHEGLTEFFVFDTQEELYSWMSK